MCRFDNLVKTFNDVIEKYQNEKLVENDDLILEWSVKMTWLIKQLSDIKSGTELEYIANKRKNIK